MVIHHIGVTAFGVPVYFKHLGATGQDKEMLFSALIEAFNAIGDQLELGRIDTVAFGNNLLYVTPTKKGYRVIAIADSRESYIRNLIQKISRLIDETEDIPEPTGFVDDEIVSKIKALLDKFIVEEIPIKTAEIGSILNFAIDEIVNIVGKATVKSLDKKVETAKQEVSKKWSNFMTNVQGSFYDALESAWKGEISKATAIIFKSAETNLAVALAIRLGLLSNMFHKLLAPPIELMKQLLNYLVEGDIYVSLINKAFNYYFYWLDEDMYRNLYLEALEQFDPKDDIESQIRALILLDEMLTTIKSEKARLLLNYYREKSESLTVYLELIEERNKTRQKINSLDLGEAQHFISVWKEKFESLLSEINKLIRKSTERYGLANEISVEIMKTFFNGSIYSEIYIGGLLHVLKNVSRDLATKMSILSQSLDMINNVTELINKGFPIYIPSCMDFMRKSAVILEYGIRIANQKILFGIVDSYKKLLTTCSDVVISEYDKMTRFFPTITNTLASIASILMFLDDYNPQLLELMYLVSKFIREDVLQSMAKHNQELFVSFIEDLLYLISYILIRKGAKDYVEKLSKIIDSLFMIIKWKMFRGSASILDALRIISILSKIVAYLDEKQLLQLKDNIDFILEIFIGDIAKSEPELVLVSEELVVLLKNFADRVKSRDAKEELEMNVKQVLSILERRDYQQKIKRIQTILEGKTQSGAILELF